MTGIPVELDGDEVDNPVVIFLLRARPDHISGKNLHTGIQANGR
jgi:hypothetical protein